MNELLRELSRFLLISGLTASTLGFVLVFFLQRIHRKDRYFFTTIFTILSLYISGKLIFVLMLGHSTSRAIAVSRIATFISFVAGTLLLPMKTSLISKASPKMNYKKIALTEISALWSLNLAILIWAQFNTLFYSFTPENGFEKGRFYPVLLIIPALMLITNLIHIVINFKHLTPDQRIVYTLYSIIPLACIAAQLFVTDLPLTTIGAAFSSLLMFIHIINKHTDHIVRQEKENASQKASILALQMRPHFIYNTLTSIYYLCDQDPKKAQSTIVDFSTYLRKNFEAIASEETVDFRKELEHTKAYLAVEQVRYGDDIECIFDTPYMDFKIPALTLQPLVENAVKHGFDPDLGKLTIKIKTEKTDKNIVITVENTGSEFGVSENNDPHIALENITLRLESMCRGTVHIEALPGGGTVVKISIPI